MLRASDPERMAQIITDETKAYVIDRTKFDVELARVAEKNGAEVGGVYLPAAQSGSPMTYRVDGKQYIIVAVSGGNYSGEYIAFSLPDSEVKTGN